MKKLIIALLVVLSMGVVQAKTVKTSFEVKGKCGMCGRRIEAAAKAVDGVMEAKWNKSTGVLTIVYNNKKTSVDAVQVAVAAVGHDTPDHKADNAVYAKLPPCCRYRGADASANTTHSECEH